MTLFWRFNYDVVLEGGLLVPRTLDFSRWDAGL